MVNINFEFKKKDMFLISSIFVFLIGTGLIIAFTTDGSGDPTIMGHSADEMKLPSCIVMDKY